MQRDLTPKAKCKSRKTQQSLDFSPYSSRVGAKCVFRDTTKYHQFTICFSPLLNELFCYRICWIINLIQLLNDKKKTVNLFCTMINQDKLTSRERPFFIV